MAGLSRFLDKQVDIEISGNTNFTGTLLDIGQDIIVIYDGRHFLYIPLLHLQRMNQSLPGDLNEGAYTKKENPHPETQENSFSYRNTLLNIKGKFTEVFVTGDRSIHGYVTSVLNDYIVFFSPVYKTLFISMHHLKWLTPYSTEQTPYTLKSSELPVVPSNVPLVRNFEEQLKKYIGQLIILDLGDIPNKVGLLKDVSNNILELTNASGHTVFWKLNHLKTMHLP
ncbi:DUF2642 domain-containing protein [Bacillus nakamurai]|uniref:DUF2642 domain-containing protein n=1 Tax=Bacillus nakamurai TaxID=1793963 RepID=UPI001E284829|nr:DUF2642 domain-containing protein [Bacillus nakamurai]MCC9024212.1 DUF2642 domain-containing protein [Bacillus nakamurai]